MGIDIRTLKNDDCKSEHVLVCNTTGIAFGHVFEAEWEVVQQFLQTLPEDARRYETGELEAEWHKFLDTYECASCGSKGNPQATDLTLNGCCGRLFCITHEGDEVWEDPTHPDGPKSFGHECPNA